MQEDLLTDFNFPNINLEHLHKVFSQNTIELPTMLEEHDDFLKKNKITSPGCKGLPVPVLSKLNNRKSELFDTDEQIEEWENGGLKIVLEKLLMKNCSAVNRLNIVNSDMNELPKTKSVKKIVEYGKIASDLGWGSENDDNGEVEILEVRPYPSRLHLDQEKELPWKVDIYNYKSNLCTNRTCEDESLCNESCDLLYSSGDTEEVAFPELENVIHTPKTSQLLDSQSSLKTAKPIRCYCRKRPKSHSDFSSTVQSFESRTVDTKTENTVKEVPFCVISEVVGNADNAFSGYSVEKESPEPSVITPKKTNDITKIKGWRRKQFLVEKPTTVEFYSYEKGSAKKKIRMEDFDSPVEEPGNVENAFVCDSLDEFLDQEAELRINYEIPHLYAEVGIKLTSEHLVSKPNLSQEAFKEVGSRYCVKLPAVEDGIIILDDNNIKKREKRRNEENFRSHKMLKTEKNRKKIIKVEEKPDESKLQLHKLLNLSKNSHNVQIKEEEESKTVVKPVVKYEELPQDISLTTKLLGVVVYPSPFKPLHPVVANHLHKLRSYRTKIDKSWANFAASAVRVKWQNRYINRKILPVLCAGKIENNSSQSCVESEVQKVVKFLVDSVCEKSASQSLIKSQRKIKVETNFNKIVDLKTSLPKKSNDFGLNLTKCDVLINKIDIGKNFKVWCMEHNCYDCSPCGYARLRKVKDTSTITTTEVCEASDLCKAEVEPPPSLFDQRITSLLAKKLRGVTFSDDILTSIDKLKILIPNGLELIKLNFVKQSFLNGYINIWYLKPKFDSIRSRAFLTFSKSPPVPKAINIKRTENSFDGLPKVIKEIVSSGEISDNDEYAILHCNGASWEIHGSLNVAIEKNEIGEEKSDVEVEQIFIPVPLPEMEDIRKTAMQILRVKATKWWVLDLSQRFSEIVLNISCRSTSITRKHLLAIIKSKFLGFLAIKRRKGRLYGTYILDTLFPFILIGPYYTFEKCTLSVKSNSSKIPFVYTGLENLTQDCSLKFFINSVIMGLEGSDKKLDGLWLYDRKNLDNACYLETLTTDVQGSFPKTDYSVETEHGYCLNSLTNTSLLETNSGVFRR